jgi:hypothetical protein
MGMFRGLASRMPGPSTWADREGWRMMATCACRARGFGRAKPNTMAHEGTLVGESTTVLVPPLGDLICIYGMGARYSLLLLLLPRKASFH